MSYNPTSCRPQELQRRCTRRKDAQCGATIASGAQSPAPGLNSAPWRARRSNLQLAITPPTLAPRQVRRGQTRLMGMRGRRISGRKHQVQQSHHPSGVRKLGGTLEGSDCTGTPETSFHCTVREEVSHLHRFRGQSRSDEIVRGLSYAMDERGVHPRARRLSTTCTSFH